jgi:hypothetical protein
MFHSVVLTVGEDPPGAISVELCPAFTVSEEEFRAAIKMWMERYAACSELCPLHVRPLPWLPSQTEQNNFLRVGKAMQRAHRELMPMLRERADAVARFGYLHFTDYSRSQCVYIKAPAPI